LLPWLVLPSVSCGNDSDSSKSITSIVVDMNTNLNYNTSNNLYDSTNYQIKVIYHLSDKCEVAKIYSNRNASYSIEKINGINIYSDSNYVFVANYQDSIYSITDAYLNVIISNDELNLLNEIIDYSDFYDENKFYNASVISDIVLEEKAYKARYYAFPEDYYLLILIDINFRKHIFTDDDFNFLSYTKLDYIDAPNHDKFIDGTYVNADFMKHPRYNLWFNSLDDRTKAIDYLLENKPYFIQGVYGSSTSWAA
jgi:hypothetical protein